MWTMRTLDWNEFKNAINLRKHKIGFATAERFEWDTADIEIDDREDYGEMRECAYGFIGDVHHVLVFVD